MFVLEQNVLIIHLRFLKPQFSINFYFNGYSRKLSLIRHRNYVCIIIFFCTIQCFYFPTSYILSFCSPSHTTLRAHEQCRKHSRMDLGGYPNIFWNICAKFYTDEVIINRFGVFSRHKSLKFELWNGSFLSFLGSKLNVTFSSFMSLT